MKEPLDSFDSLTNNNSAVLTGDITEKGYPYYEDEGGKSLLKFQKIVFYL